MLETIFYRADPFLRISKNGESYVFELTSATTRFENIEKLKTDKYFETLYEVTIKYGISASESTTLADSPEDGLKIYKDGDKYIFKHSQGITEFNSLEELRKDNYWLTIHDTFVYLEKQK